MSSRNRQRRAPWFLVVLVLSLGAGGRAGAGFVTDQSQTTLDVFLNLATNAPVGQEFTPGAASMDTAEIELEDAFVGHGPPASFNLLVRAGGLNGALVGTSSTVSLATGFDRSAVLFTFPTALTLVPGNLYALQVNEVSGSTYFVGGTAQDFYSGGRAIVSGNPVPPGFLIQDLYFREGSSAVPEPGSLALLGLGCLVLIGLARPARRRRPPPVGA
jgi:hypothetical protein